MAAEFLNASRGAARSRRSPANGADGRQMARRDCGEFLPAASPSYDEHSLVCVQTKDFFCSCSLNRPATRRVFEGARLEHLDCSRSRSCTFLKMFALCFFRQKVASCKFLVAIGKCKHNNSSLQIAAAVDRHGAQLVRRGARLCLSLWPHVERRVFAGRKQRAPSRVFCVSRSCKYLGQCLRECRV